MNHKEVTLLRVNLNILVKGPGGARGLSAGQLVCTTPSSQMLKILWKSGAKHSANKPS